MKKYLSQIEKARQNFEKEISSIASRFRKEVIKPVCKKHGLTFISANGHFFFADDFYINISPSSFYKEEKAIYQKANLDPIFAVLDTETSHNQYFGYYVSDVKINKKK